MATAAAHGQTTLLPRVVQATERLGVVFPLLLVWLFFDFGRPAHPMNIPLLVSVIAFTAWIPQQKKQWAPHTKWFLVLLGVMVAGVPLAPNGNDAFLGTRDMAVRFLCICLPLQWQINTVRKVRLWVYCFLAVAGYVGGWALLHDGFGPARRSGHDENYVAAIMGMAVPFAYFSLFVEKRLVARVLLVTAIVLAVGAMGAAYDPSRGGFLGLCAGALYCLARSSNKMLGIGILGVAGLTLLLLAGPTFWAEIGTTTAYDSGTGDFRLEIWSAGLRMWRANPLLGVGVGNFRWVIGDYQTQAQLEKFGRSLGGSIIAHSLPIEVLAELGTAGAVATVALVYRTWVVLGEVRQASAQRPGQFALNSDLAQIHYFAEAVRASILAVLVNGLFLSLAYYSHIWLLIAVGSALPFVLRARLRSAGLDPAATEARHKAPSRGGIVRQLRSGSVRPR